MDRVCVLTREYLLAHLDLDLFWQHVNAEESGCWTWQGYTTKGYGRFKVNGRNELVHRIAYVLTVGPLSRETLLMHSCDVPNCLRVRHLSPGDQAANIADKVAKKRQARGEQINTAQLTSNQVLEIWLRLDNGEKGAQLAEEFGVTPTQISRLKKRACWKHLMEYVDG